MDVWIFSTQVVRWLKAFIGDLYLFRDGLVR